MLVECDGNQSSNASAFETMINTNLKMAFLFCLFLSQLPKEESSCFTNICHKDLVQQIQDVI